MNTLIQEYKDNGLQLVPIPVGRKSPIIKGWNIPADRSIPDGDNVGVLTGACSAIVDIDLDTPAAVEVARYLLNGEHLTEFPIAAFGRPSKPVSHIVIRQASSAAVKISDPSTREVLVEIRSDGQQTIFPPSVHPSGENLEWLEDYPPSILWKNIETTPWAEQLAAMITIPILIAPSWVAGARNDLGLALAGYLLKSGWPATRVAGVIGAIAWLTSDPESLARQNMVTSTVDRMAQGQTVIGWTGLESLLPKPILRLLNKLVNLSASGPPPGSLRALLTDAITSAGYTLRLNLLEDAIECNGKMLDDFQLAEINLHLVQAGYRRSDIYDGIRVAALANTYHPVQSYLTKTNWDGQDYFSKMMDHIEADVGPTVEIDGQPAPLQRALIWRWLLGCVVRAMRTDDQTFVHQNPMLVLVGPQGIGKSSWVRWLASGIGFEYHRESAIDPHNPETARSMVTRWLWEVSELGSSLRKGDRDSLKALITQEHYVFRKPYDRMPVRKPALCSLVGTLNEETGFLDDPTGNRRFLPVAVKSITFGYETAVPVDQLWAQVVHAWRTGATPILSKAEQLALLPVYQANEVENLLTTYIQMYFEVDPSQTDWRCHTATIAQILQANGIRLSDHSRIAGRQLNDVLRPMGLSNNHGIPFRSEGVLARGWLGIRPRPMATLTFPTA